MQIVNAVSLSFGEFVELLNEATDGQVSVIKEFDWFYVVENNVEDKEIEQKIAEHLRVKEIDRVVINSHKDDDTVIIVYH